MLSIFNLLPHFSHAGNLHQVVKKAVYCVSLPGSSTTLSRALHNSLSATLVSLTSVSIFKWK